MGISSGLGVDKKQLMLVATELEDKQVEGQCKGDVINEELNRLTRNDSCSRKRNLRVGNEDWWENVTLEGGANLKIVEGKKNEDRSGKSDEDAVVNGPRNAKGKPISRKWKLRARKIIAEERVNVGPINAKRPSSDGF